MFKKRALQRRRLQDLTHGRFHWCFQTTLRAIKAPPQVQPLPMSMFMAFMCSAPTKRAQMKISPTLKAPVSVMEDTQTADPSCGCSMRTFCCLILFPSCIMGVLWGFFLIFKILLGYMTEFTSSYSCLSLTSAQKKKLFKWLTNSQIKQRTSLPFMVNDLYLCMYILASSPACFYYQRAFKMKTLGFQLNS